MPQIKTLILLFDTPLRRADLPLFRGAVIAAIPSGNLLFHNHDGKTLRYAYPLIQYKRIKGKAAIVCIGEGIRALEELFVHADFNICIGKHPVVLKIEDIRVEETDLKPSPLPLSYHIKDWIALNEVNYRHFQSTESLVERTRLLEKILTGNILSLLKGLGIFINFRLQVVITDYTIGRPVEYKHLNMVSIDLDFSVNLSLPDYIGIGKHSSLGAGLLTRKKSNNNL